MRDILVSSKIGNNLIFTWNLRQDILTERLPSCRYTLKSVMRKAKCRVMSLINASSYNIIKSILMYVLRFVLFKNQIREMPVIKLFEFRLLALRNSGQRSLELFVRNYPNRYRRTTEFGPPMWQGEADSMSSLSQQWDKLH